MLNFELPSYVNDIERVITKSLAQNQKPSSDFRWYLSLHLDHAIEYNAQHVVLADNKSSYSCIKPILYQRSEFYANDCHFLQFSHQHQNIHKSANPSLYLAWLNAVQPHSLSGHKAEQGLSDKLIENTSFTTQAAHKQKVYENIDSTLCTKKEGGDEPISYQDSGAIYEVLPKNDQVDFLFKSAAQALAPT